VLFLKSLWQLVAATSSHRIIKVNSFGEHKDLKICLDSLHDYEVKPFFVLDIIVIIDRLLGKLVYLARLSDCIIASLYDSHSLIIEISLCY
jgi:hypothetical protein